MAGREILQRPLDAAANAVTGLPTAVAASDAVPLSQMQAADTAVGAAATAAVAAEAAARAAADLLIPGTITALTGDVTASGTGAVPSTIANLPQTPLLTRLAALTSPPSVNGQVITSLGSGGTTPTNAANIGDILAVSGRTPKLGDFWVYVIDYDGGGSDTTGAPGISTSMATALSLATPLKTLEKFGQIRPGEGLGATLVLLIKPRTGGATYRNIANTADQDGSFLNGMQGWRLIVRGSLDFVNDSNDKIRAGFLTLSGTNAGGYNATAGSTTTSLVCQQVGGGAAGFTAESGGSSPLTSCRIRFTASTATVALRNFATGIWKNTTGTIIPMQTLPATPDPTDVFVIETPGATFGSLTFTAGWNYSVCLVGLSATASSTTSFQTPTCRYAGCNFTALTVANGDLHALGPTYVDETGAIVQIGFGTKITGTFLAQSTRVLSVVASGWLSSSSQLDISGSVLQCFVGSGCVTVQGLRNSTTYGPTTTQFGNFGSATFRRLRVTGATLGARSAVHLSGTGAGVYGVDLSNCTNSLISVSSQPSAVSKGGQGSYVIDDIVSPDGGNTFSNNPPQSAVLQVIGAHFRGATRIYCGTLTPITATADRDIIFDGGSARFQELNFENLHVWGALIYGPDLHTGSIGGGSAYYNDFVTGPSIVTESHNTSFFANGPYPPFRVWRFVGNTPNGAGTPPVTLPAIADVPANCKSIAGVSMNYAPNSGDLIACLQAGPTVIEFVTTGGGALTPLTSSYGDQMAYLSELGGADSGKARVGPPSTGEIVPLGPIHAHCSDTLAIVNLIPAPQPMSVVATNLPVFTSTAQGVTPASGGGATNFLRADGTWVAPTAAAIPLAGHAAESVIGNPTAGTANAADIAVATDSVVGRSGSGHVGSISMTAAGRAMAGAASATAQTALLDAFAGGVKGLVPASAGGTANFLRADGSYAAPLGTAGVTSLTGDVTGTGPGATATTIANDAVTNAKAANMANATIKARITAGTGDPEDATGTQVTALLDVFTTSAKGLAPTSPGGTSAFLRADGTWVTPPGTGGGGPLTGLSGDVTTVGGGVAPATISNDAVTFAKMQNIATQTLIGRQTAGTGDPESIGVTGNLEFDGSGNIRRSALTGDVSASAGSAGTVINTGVVTNTQLAVVPTGTLKGRTAAGTGAPSDLTFAAVKTALAISFLDITGTLQAAQFPALTGDVTTVAGALATTLSATGVTANTYGDSSHVGQFTVDAKGRISAASSPSISITAGAVSGLAAIATSGSGADLTANSVTDAKLRQGGATSVIGRASATTGNVADIAATVDDRVFGRRASALGFFQADTPMIADGAINLPKHQNFPALVVLGNNTLSTTIPTYVTMSSLRTMLGLDAPQHWDLRLSYGIGFGNNADSLTPASLGPGNWPFFLLPHATIADYPVLGYAGGSNDANLNDARFVNNWPVQGTFAHGELSVSCSFLDNVGAGSVVFIMTKNGFVDSSPLSVSVPNGGGNFGSGVVALGAFSVVSGDNIGVRAQVLGGGGNVHMKTTVSLRLTP